MIELKAQTLVLYGPKGEEVELNAATIYDIQLLNPDGFVLALIDGKFIPHVKSKMKIPRRIS